MMATDSAINDKRLHEALEISGLKTNRDTVNPALKESVDRHKQLEILNIFWKMDPDPDHDHKKGKAC